MAKKLAEDNAIGVQARPEEALVWYALCKNCKRDCPNPLCCDDYMNAIRRVNDKVNRR